MIERNKNFFFFLLFFILSFYYRNYGNRLGLMACRRVMVSKYKRLKAPRSKLHCRAALLEPQTPVDESPKFLACDIQLNETKSTKSKRFKARTIPETWRSLF